jgi:hypothetical protein
MIICLIPTWYFLISDTSGTWIEEPYRYGHQVVGLIFGFQRLGNTIYTRFRDAWDMQIRGFLKTFQLDTDSNSSSDSNIVGPNWPFPLDVNSFPLGCGNPLTELELKCIVHRFNDINDAKIKPTFWVQAMCAPSSLHLCFMFMVDELQGVL